ncbi:MAG: hypothetical protein QOH49_1193 [Acidobacteriota bacterium]|jgi:hypothetical protein|nr:hypothetical protein [Acidobacteriota bacterium]
MWGKVLSLAFAAALVSTGAAFRTQAQAPRKATPRPTPTPAVEQRQPKKVSQRPEEVKGTEEVPASVRAGIPAKPKEDPNVAHYVYEFKQPDFFVYFIHIEHDDNGRGQIRFERRSDAEQITEPFELSPVALARVRARWDALGFLDSQANYQGERTYPSMGQTKLIMRRGGRERTAEFNYSQDKDAQGLAEEYRKASEQSVLVFELQIARESQPLETPKLINKLDTLIERDYLSDRQQLVPLIRELTEDERVPLVGRNQAARILKKLEKQAQ